MSGTRANGELSQGVIDVPYAIPNIRCENGEAEPHVRIGWFARYSTSATPSRSCSFAMSSPTGRARPKDYLLELLGRRGASTLRALQNYGDDINVYPIDTGRLRPRGGAGRREGAVGGRSLPPATASHRRPPQLRELRGDRGRGCGGKDGTGRCRGVDMAVDCGFAAYRTASAPDGRRSRHGPELGPLR